MKIKLHDINLPCSNCGAVGPCCDTSKARLETANSLAALVKRQEEIIEKQGDVIVKCGCHGVPNGFHKYHLDIKDITISRLESELDALREELRCVREAAGR